MGMFNREIPTFWPESLDSAIFRFERMRRRWCKARHQTSFVAMQHLNKGFSGETSDLTAGLFLAGDRDLNHGPMGDGFGHGDTAFAVLFSLEQDL